MIVWYAITNIIGLIFGNTIITLIIADIAIGIISIIFAKAESWLFFGLFLFWTIVGLIAIFAFNAEPFSFLMY
jgi:hypothetical protein